MEKRNSVNETIGEKGNEAISAISDAVATCRLPIHVRSVACNLNEASVRLLANSLLINSTLIGFINSSGLDEV